MRKDTNGKKREWRRNAAMLLITALLVLLTVVVLRMDRLPYKELTYGQSGGGRPLTAYRLGNGENVMILTFAIHGFEDGGEKDGRLLTDTAEKLVAALRKSPETIREGDWTVYVLPCLNPDGCLDGWTENGPGRCTLYGLDDKGNLIYGQGIDMNRSFPYDFVPGEDARHNTGPQPLLAPEAKALADFTESVMGNGKNVCVDTHGWLAQIIPSGGENSALYGIFKAAFPECQYAGLRVGSGYYSAWVGYTLGYDACLFEFPGGYYDEKSFGESGLAERYIQAVFRILREYEGPAH